MEELGNTSIHVYVFVTPPDHIKNTLIVGTREVDNIAQKRCNGYEVTFPELLVNNRVASLEMSRNVPHPPKNLLSIRYDPLCYN